MADRIVVVGAGVFGAAASVELRRRGLDVTLVDPGPVPHPLAASTDVSKVVRLDYGADEGYMALMEEALAGWRAWNQRWGTLFHEDGFLVVSRDPMRSGGFEHDSFALLKKRGHPVERLSPAELARRFPAWNAGAYADGYFNPQGGWAESGRVVEALVADARAAGVVVRDRAGISGLIERGGRIAGVALGAEALEADVVVVATGAWTPALVPELAGVMVAVGQPVFHFRVDPDAWRPPRFTTWAADIAKTGFYGFPALADGTLKIANHGAGRRMRADGARDVDPGDEALFRAFLRETFPTLEDAPLLATRLCLYCDTFDGDFWIDRHPDRPGLVVAAGGSGHAFKFAPLLGAFIAGAAVGEPDPRAARFGWRARGDSRTEHARAGGDG